jgi:hypothetical protein
MQHLRNSKNFGISEVSVKTRLLRGRRQMRQALAHLRTNRISVKNHRSSHAASRRLRGLATACWPRNLENEMWNIH